MKDLTDFETKFQTLIIEHDLQACFIAVVDEDDKGSRLFIGGAEPLCGWCTRAIRSSPQALKDEQT
jgi:hypothetical protein